MLQMTSPQRFKSFKLLNNHSLRSKYVNAVRSPSSLIKINMDEINGIEDKEFDESDEKIVIYLGIVETNLLFPFKVGN